MIDIKYMVDIEYMDEEKYTNGCYTRSTHKQWNDGVLEFYFSRNSRNSLIESVGTWWVGDQYDNGIVPFIVI